MNTEPSQPETPQSTAPPSDNHRRKYLIAGVIILLAVGVFVYWLTTRGRVVTDDAQIVGHLVPISPRVSGYIDTIRVDDNQHVEAGQLLVSLDRRDLEAALHKAEADLATQKAQAAAASAQTSLTQTTAPAEAKRASAGVNVAESGITASEKQITSAQAQARSAAATVVAARGAVAAAKSDVTSAGAQIESAKAALKQAQANVTVAQAQAKKAKDDAARYKQLFDQGAVPEQQLEAFQTASIQAQASLDSTRSGVDGAKAVLAQANARYATSKANLAQAKARLSSAMDVEAQAKAAVGIALAGQGQAQGQLGQAEAAKQAAETVPQQVGASKAQTKAALARIRQAQANVRNAQLMLSYTLIKAPVSGTVSQKSAQLGQYVQPGQMLMSVVPLRNVWVVANFKETDMEHMHAGQRATVTVDTYSGIELRGRVQSIGAASGAQFSLLPPENATGNFVKVVQRIPVKIVLDRPLPKGVVLRIGQNVVATVYL